MERFDLAEEALRAELFPMHRATIARTRMWSMAGSEEESFHEGRLHGFGEAEQPLLLQALLLLLCCCWTSPHELSNS